MARKLRQNVPGIHHVYARGNDRALVFYDDADRTDYLNLLGLVVEKMRWRCLAYCLMDNHLHLLAEITEPNLGAGMQRLQGSYTQTFNERHGRTGHVFQGRYGSRLVESDEHLWWTVAYIAHNPVKAGLCRSPADWRWSSHAATLAGTPPRWLDRRRLLECFAGAGDPHERYAALVGC